MSKFRIAIPLLLFFGVFVEEAHGSAFSIDPNEEDVPFLVETRVAPHLIQTASACCI